MKKLQELLNKLLRKLGLKEKAFKLVDKQEDVEVGKSVITFLINDGSSSSITLEGNARNYPDFIKTGNDVANDYLLLLNSNKLETDFINISPSEGNKHLVRRSDIKRLTVINSPHKIKVVYQIKEY